jgi:hypothetical protein
LLYVVVSCRCGRARCLWHLSLQRFVVRQRLPSRGSVRIVPHAHRYYALLRIPVGHPAALRFLRLAVPRLRSCFDTCAAERDQRMPEVVIPVSSSGDMSVEPRGPPRFLRNPLYACPALRPRRDRNCQALATLRCCLPRSERRRLPHLNPFVAQ